MACRASSRRKPPGCRLRKRSTSRSAGRSASRRPPTRRPRLAPPAPETVAMGAAAPPRGEDIRPMGPGRPGLTGRLNPPVTDQDHDPLDGPAPVGGLLPPPEAPRGAFGRPGPTQPPSPLGTGPGRHGGAQDGMQRPSMPLPSGAPVTGLGDPLAEGDPRHGSGLIDPDEPTEGIRLLQ